MAPSESSERTPPQGHSVAGLITDLIFATKLRSTASAIDVHAAVVSTTDALVSEMSSRPVALVIVDLEAVGDPVAAIERIASVQSVEPNSSPPTRILAYCSHVRADLMERARQAGADDVWPRSRLADRLPELLATVRSGHTV